MANTLAEITVKGGAPEAYLMDANGRVAISTLRCLCQVLPAISRIIITLTSSDNHIKFKSLPVKGSFDFLRVSVMGWSSVAGKWLRYRHNNCGSGHAPARDIALSWE